MEALEKKVKILFICRIILWVLALIATIYWIHWSFEIYQLGFENEHDYAVHFRPYFRKGLWSSVAFVVISLYLRKISDKIKQKIKHAVE